MSEDIEKRRYLIISRNGRDSVHESWLEGDGEREFDVLLSSYDLSLDLSGHGVMSEIRPGTNVASLNDLFKEHINLIRQYEYIALFDDDLLTSRDNLNEMFRTCSKYNLKIAQPALTSNSHYTFAALLRQRAFRLRYVNFIEMMCPVFRLDVFEKVMPLFELGYEVGIDLIWCNLVYENPYEFAVIDSTPVCHVRPIGTRKASNGFPNGRRYEDDIYAILDDFSLPWLPCIPYAAVNNEEELVRSRIKIFLSALQTLLSVPQKRPILKRLRASLTHVNHLRRRSCNIPVSIQTAGNSPA